MFDKQRKPPLLSRTQSPTNYGLLSFLLDDEDRLYILFSLLVPKLCLRPTGPHHHKSVRLSPFSSILILVQHPTGQVIRSLYRLLLTHLVKL
jgi:hypothetical protein